MGSRIRFLVDIDVPDLEAGTRFYAEAFGLQVGRRFAEPWVELVGGPTPIYLLEKAPGKEPAPGVQGRDYRRHWSPIHLDFVVPRLEEAVERAVAAGAVVESSATQEPYGRIAMLADPFGNGLCIIEMNEAGYDAPELHSRPDFSSMASEYARSRPVYPPELFKHLASLAPGHRVAWDCATGNGQAAVSLAEWFDHVIATDSSAEQIRLARPHPRIEYRVAPAEASGVAARSVELVTVASAVHWFDRRRFFEEARRVSVDGGVLAVWTYHVCHIGAPLTELFARFYADVLAPYFDEGARLVDDRYQSLELPGERLDSPEFRAIASMNLEQMMTFIHSWSGTRRYVQRHGRSPLELIRGELEALWGEPQNRLDVEWPLYLRVSRLSREQARQS